MKYNVGDRVHIIQSPPGVYQPYMIGEIATIKSCEYKSYGYTTYGLKEDKVGYIWRESCFESAEKQINPKTISKKEFLRLINGE